MNNNRLYRIIISIFVFACNACTNNNDDRLFFIGDSLISRWDLEEYFPMRLVTNEGLSGSGITWIEDHKGAFAGETVVMLSGTNNLGSLMTEAVMQEYAVKYVEAANKLGAARLLMVSILPRNFEGDMTNINIRIKQLNALICKEVLKHGRGIVYVDVHNDFEQDGVMNAQYSYDGLHLSSYGYDLLAAKIKSYL